LLKQPAFILPPSRLEILVDSLKMLRDRGQDEAAEQLKETCLKRMLNVSRFRKELKQRFS
jgi:hypothetical protein